MLGAVVGHETTKHLLEEMLKLKRVPHALLFYGPEGVGKTFCAKLFAREILNTISDVDLKIFCPEEGLHSIASIKQLQEEAYDPPFHAEKKVIIIKEAHKMLPSSSNALLKTLEEPNEQVIFILIAPSIKSLLPTISSRCCKVEFRLLSESTIEKHLLNIFEINKEKAASAAKYARGSIGKAEFYLKNESIHEPILDLVLKFHHLSFEEAQKKIKEIEEKSPSQQEIYEVVLQVLRDLVIVSAGVDSSLLFFNQRYDEFKKAATRVKLPKESLLELWMNMWEGLTYHVKLKHILEALPIKLYA